MKNLLIVSLVGMLIAVGLVGCSPIIVGGPFVTDIAYDGEGNLLITKNTITYDPWWGHFSNGANPQTIVINALKKE